MEALDALRTLVPQWHDRLDELNGQIALRQIELARLEEAERPPTRSMKNKGSTESLRPRDGEGNPFASANDVPMNPFDTPKSGQDEFSPERPSSSKVTRAATVTTPPPPKATSNPRTSSGLIRKASNSTPPTQRPNVLRKRKTESLASGESVAPKYRTRSMIIIYYDGAVQTAFEELVKFVSGSRNSMRKGKMAAKMAEMKRAAELEVASDEGDSDEDGDDLQNILTNSGHFATAHKTVPLNKQSQNKENGDADGLALPQLKFVSTRQMGPPRINGAKTNTMGSTLSLGLLRGYRRGGGEAPDIFDELDKGLEWCQSQCEHAAHQFLRDGECNTEIENIKRKLSEVRDTAIKEMERIKAEEAANPVITPVPEQNKSRELRKPQLRRDVQGPKDLEVDDMEVDDEAVEVDINLPSKLVFKRSRDIGAR